MVKNGTQTRPAIYLCLVNGKIHIMGTKVPEKLENKSSREQKSHRTVIPGDESSRERTGQGENRPGTERSRDRKFQGTNWPGSEKAGRKFARV